MRVSFCMRAIRVRFHNTRAWSPHTQPEAVVCDSVTPAPVAAAPDVRDKVTDENANVNPYPNANPNPEVIDESLNLTV